MMHILPAPTHIDADQMSPIPAADPSGKIRGVRAEESVEAVALDFELETSRAALIQAVMRVPSVRPQAGEIRAAERLVDLVIGGMGANAEQNLSAFGERAARRVATLVADQLKIVARQDVVFSNEVHFAPLGKVRKASKEHLADHTEPFSKSLAYDGWRKCLYEYAWFDTSPEYKAAQALDNGKDVIVWARLHINDLPITWTQEGREYNPDLVAIEEVEGKRICWLIETKMNKEVKAEDVQAKMRAAKTWANTINTSGSVDCRWNYILLSEDDVDDAGGDWERMKAFGTQ